jgi:hypothetical protein
MKRISMILIVVLLICTVSISAAAFSEEEWLEDINYLEKELPTRHKNLFFQLEEKEFENEIEKLKSDLSQLSDLEITLRLAEIFAKIGDTHTALDNTRFLNEYYPFFLKKFEAGYRVITTDQKYKKILGAKLISINDYSVEELKQKLSRIITADNQASLDNRMNSFLNLKDVLVYLEIVGSDNEFLFEKTGQKIKINFEALKIKNITKNSSSLVSLDYQPGIVLKNTNQLFWSNYLKEESLLYFQYNSCWSRELADKHGRPNSELPSFEAEKSKVFNLISDKEIDKLVIDLRFNSGGDSSQGTKFAEELSSYKDQFETYVIIGADTFSSAIINALDFKKQLDAYLIGTATMGKPNHYGEVKSFKLPNTGLNVSYSTNYFTLLKDSDPDSLYPDITVETSFKDFINGEDTAFKMIKSIK